MHQLLSNPEKSQNKCKYWLFLGIKKCQKQNKSALKARFGP